MNLTLKLFDGATGHFGFGHVREPAPPANGRVREPAPPIRVTEASTGIQLKYEDIGFDFPPFPSSSKRNNLTNQQTAFSASLPAGRTGITIAHPPSLSTTTSAFATNSSELDNNPLLPSRPVVGIQERTRLFESSPDASHGAVVLPSDTDTHHHHETEPPRPLNFPPYSFRGRGNVNASTIWASRVENGTRDVTTSANLSPTANGEGFRGRGFIRNGNGTSHSPAQNRRPVGRGGAGFSDREFCNMVARNFTDLNESLTNQQTAFRRLADSVVGLQHRVANIETNIQITSNFGRSAPVPVQVQTHAYFAGSQSPNVLQPAEQPARVQSPPPEFRVYLGNDGTRDVTYELRQEDQGRPSTSHVTGSHRGRARD